jgi:hypothetical protein
MIDDAVEQFLHQRRATDGYINASAMCDVAGKDFQDFFRNEGETAWSSYPTSELLETIENETGVPCDEQIRDAEGKIWVHPYVGYKLAEWLSPAFSVKLALTSYQHPALRRKVDAMLHEMETPRTLH